MGNKRTKTTLYHYTAHRLDSVSYDDALSTVYHYNAYGQPDSVYDESGVMCYEYGDMGEVTKETRIYALPFLPQPLALSTLFEYDSWGRILNITYPDNEIVNYDYDLGGQLFRMYNNSSYNYLDNIIYDKFGAKTSQDYGNGIVTQYTYNDTTRRLTDILTSNNFSLHYTYDLVGNVTQVTSTCPWLQNQSFTETFSYDSTDQLVSANETQSYQLAVNYGNWGKIMQYDIAQTDMLSNATETHSRSYAYPTANYANAQTSFAPVTQTGDEQVSLSYGINGSLRQRNVQTPNPHIEYYLFNSQGNLKAYSDDVMSFAYYGYNAANTRTYKLSLYNTNVWINGQQQPLNLQWQQAMFYPNTYLNFDAFGNYTKHYYNGTERIASRLGDNTITIAINSDNTLEDRKLLLEEHFREDIHKLIYETVPIDMPPFMDVNTLQPTGTPNDIYYYHPNHLGNTAFVTDQNQSITQGFLYAPFGEITTEYNVNFGNNVIPKYSFNAKELDEETGMFYYEARYYAPPVFTSRDAMFEKYFWMSPYTYCANNPVKYVDPSGREFVDNEGNRVRVRVLKNGNIQYKFSRKTSETAKSDFISNHSESLSALSKTKQGRKCISFLNRCYTSVYINPTNESGNQNSSVIPSCDENNYVKMNNGVYENVEIKPFMGSIRNKANQDNVDVDEILGATLIVEAGHLKKNQISRDYNEKLSEESKYYSLYNQYVDYRYNYRKELKQPINETVFNNSSNIHPKLNRINSKRKMQYVK